MGVIANEFVHRVKVTGLNKQREEVLAMYTTQGYRVVESGPLVISRSIAGGSFDPERFQVTLEFVQKRKLPGKLKDGIPVDPNDMTEDDWRDLHEAIETVKAKVAARHKRRCEVCGWPLAKTAADGCVEGNCSQRGR